MSDIYFFCPNCGQHLDAPFDMAGDEVSCPSCQKSIRVPHHAQRAASTPDLTKEPQGPAGMEVETNVKQGALIGGWVCFLLGIVFVFLTLWSFILYGPLFFAAFVLSIVAMAQKRIWGGILLLLATLVIPPLCLVLIPAFKIANAVAETHVSQTQNLSDSGNQPILVITNTIKSLSTVPQKQSHEVGTSQPEALTPIVPELKLGESVVIDAIRITPRLVRFGHIERKSMYEEKTTRSEKKHLIVDVLLENTSDGKIVYLQKVWGKTKILDNFENIEDAKFSDGLMMDTIVGCIGSAKMKPSDNLHDMIIFDLPVDAAKQFTIESDPGFWRSIGEDRVRQLSDSSFRLRFTRDEIEKE